MKQSKDMAHWNDKHEHADEGDADYAVVRSYEWYLDKARKTAGRLKKAANTNVKTKGMLLHLCCAVLRWLACF